MECNEVWRTHGAIQRRNIFFFLLLLLGAKEEEGFKLLSSESSRKEDDEDEEEKEEWTGIKASGPSQYHVPPSLLLAGILRQKSLPLS